MQHSIGKMNERVTLLYRVIQEDDRGEFIERKVKGKSFWAKIIPYNLNYKVKENEWNSIQFIQKRAAYKVVMRNNHSSHALQADLVGLSFRCKEMKILYPLLPSEDEQWLETVVVDYGVTEKDNG